MNPIQELQNLREEITRYKTLLTQQQDEIHLLELECKQHRDMSRSDQRENVWLWKQVETQQKQIWKYIRVIKRLQELILIPN